MQNINFNDPQSIVESDLDTQKIHFYLNILYEELKAEFLLVENEKEGLDENLDDINKKINKLKDQKTSLSNEIKLLENTIIKMKNELKQRNNQVPNNNLSAYILNSTLIIIIIIVQKFVTLIFDILTLLILTIFMLIKIKYTKKNIENSIIPMSINIQDDINNEENRLNKLSETINQLSKDLENLEKLQNNLVAKIIYIDSLEKKIKQTKNYINILSNSLPYKVNVKHWNS